ncbi:S-formylglutathione hydrolase [Palleronia sediminis]|uniref:S-formylglutathione hydrolase n=1 Tax=Palleronia sediminis TaxID=2547833 RepID=A0A4R6AB99_9RHOB|nr:S-formylglutathione hydrolase [Palleronia sediminis]TDL78403.1 S-formylglutathione hydrolase [Palleronia sediminis]
METISEQACFGGVQGVYRHGSQTCDCDMTFGLFLPDEARDGPVPVLWFLSGLTCTHENAMTKAGAQAHAAAEGIALVFPDTSPRGAEVADADDFAMGQGASFYVNATQAPWSKQYRMWDYLAQELPDLLAAEVPLDMGRQAITGHSMGGHGALTLGMGLKGRFRSISAFAPMSNTTQSDWGVPQLSQYLGEDRTAWEAHDASLLMARDGFDGPVLIDQGTADQFLDKLRPEALARAIAERRQEATFRMQPGYDHSYFFVSSFMEDHVEFHAQALWA